MTWLNGLSTGFALGIIFIAGLVGRWDIGAPAFGLLIVSGLIALGRRHHG